MEFRVRKGPWDKIFSGNLEGFEVEMYSNTEGLILVSVLEKENEEIQGSVIEIFKVFHAEGSVEDFLETLPKEATAIFKHEPKETIKFLLLSSSPSYVKYEENVFCDEADKLMEKLITSSSTIKEFSKAYDLQLIEIEKSPERIRSSFFSHPLIVPLLSPKEMPGINNNRETRSSSQEIVSGKGSVMLGLTKGGTMINEPLNLMMKTTIFGSTPKDRKHVIHLIAEGALMSSTPAVLFDWDKSFLGLNRPNPEAKLLKDYKVDLEPIGFPIKHFTRDQVHVDLNLITVKGLLELIGLKEGEEQQIISKLIKDKKPNSMEELIAAAKKIELRDEAKITNKYRAIRILSLISHKYKGLFGGKNEIKEISKEWGKSIGKVGIIHMEGLDEFASTLLIHNLLKGISVEYSKTGKGINSFVLLPEIKEVLGSKDQSIMTTEIIDLLNKLKSVGVGFALSSDRPIDLRKEVMKISEAEIFLINRNDVGVKVAKSKQFRIKLRPGLSACEEK
ncbi:MAG: hypothetical protein COT90_05430 [Candidatus Diapherotrites archaeon CG10_big_fil_rev_8_21_14_0_10_31_34]|nr:MAG: hypothetical protein COT90_05430 [Candidatus Diapherotrites archaeon CG10_big_fil_rev_8_21_14_0_10_31_34]